MPDEIRSRTVSIIHFDDDMNTVSMIPNSLFYTYLAERRQWMVKDSTISNKFVEQFELRPDPTYSVVVRYQLIDDEESVRAAFEELMQSPDKELIKDAIGIFDLMRARPESNDMEEIGLDLYREARDKFGLAANRLFILSGFPRLFEARHPQVPFAESQILEKPFAATHLIRLIIQLLPKCVQI